MSSLRYMTNDGKIHEVPMPESPKDGSPMLHEINKPAHYNDGRIYEPVDVIRDWQLGYFIGQVLKYISRAGRKHDEKDIKDLRKAFFYLAYELGSEGVTVEELTETVRVAAGRFERGEKK